MRYPGLLVILLAGCSIAPPPTEGSAAQAESAAPTITFAADWTSSASGPLVPGAPALLVYDVSRLPGCRATYNGLPAWAIQASFAADGGFATNLGVTSGEARIEIPYGHDLAFWFLNSDEHGCVAWDSDYGRNFHFPIAPAPDPTIHFRRDWSISVENQLRAGAPMVIDYDLSRLPSCRAMVNGVPRWDVQVDYRFDGGPIATAPLASAPSPYDRAQVPARIPVPAGVSSVELWFEATDATGCAAWDSDYGNNFQFSF